MTAAWRALVVGTTLAVTLGLTGPAAAGDMTRPGDWAALASDRLAGRVGDSLTVIIYENASASNSAKKGSKRNTRASGEISSPVRSEGGQLSLASGFDGDGQSGRSDRMMAQISVLVTEVLPNGDLRVAGEQALDVNGERTRISVRGRVRPADISSANTVLSTRLAEAMIDYNGAGFVTRSARPGLITRALGYLGLF